MTKRRFLITSLAAAGFAKSGQAAPPPNDGVDAARPSLEPAIFNRFSQDHLFSLATHRSHSSHSSHSSHRSGSSGGYYSPAPVYSAPVYTSPPPPVRAPQTLRGNTATFTSIVRQVQLALQAFGYYSGGASGVVDAATRAALKRFQTDYSLKVTGTITPETLDGLRVSAN